MSHFSPSVPIVDPHSIHTRESCFSSPNSLSHKPHGQGFERESTRDYHFPFCRKRPSEKPRCLPVWITLDYWESWTQVICPKCPEVKPQKNGPPCVRPKGSWGTSRAEEVFVSKVEAWERLKPPGGSGRSQREAATVCARSQSCKPLHSKDWTAQAAYKRDAIVLTSPKDPDPPLKKKGGCYQLLWFPPSPAVSPPWPHPSGSGLLPSCFFFSGEHHSEPMIPHTHPHTLPNQVIRRFHKQWCSSKIFEHDYWTLGRLWLSVMGGSGWSKVLGSSQDLCSCPAYFTTVQYFEHPLLLLL